MNISKLKKQASLFLLCSAISILSFVLYLFSYYCTIDLTQITPSSLLLSIPALMFTVCGVFHAFMLLLSMKKGDSPFIAPNVRHLNWIGWLFVAYEPVNYICQTISNRFFPVILPSGIRMTTTYTYGGLFLVCGFVILTLSTVFRYGMELQQLSDETL